MWLMVFQQLHWEMVLFFTYLIWLFPFGIRKNNFEVGSFKLRHWKEHEWSLMITLVNATGFYLGSVVS